MKPAAARTVHIVDFGTRSTPRPTHAPKGRVPRVARLLALAHRIDKMVCDGGLRDLAHAAEVCGVTRARISQIANLLLLAPGIQEAVLDLPRVTGGRDSVNERMLRPIVAKSDWHIQTAMWNRMRGES